MFRLLLFLKAIYVPLIFIVLEITAGYVFFKSNPYQRAVAINISNKTVGAINQKATNISDYFSLGIENEKLAKENAQLRQMLSQYTDNDSIEKPTLIFDKYIAAKVVRNSVGAQNNFITINKGSDHGIEKEMALLNNDGIVGYILDCSENFSVAVSVLNYRDFRTIGKLKGSDNSGKISWDGKDTEIVQFTGIPKYSQIAVGDTVLTNQYSNIFPENYPIGKVRDFVLDNGTSFNANVELFADLSKIRYVYAVMNPGQKERAALEKSTIKE